MGERTQRGPRRRAGGGEAKATGRRAWWRAAEALLGAGAQSLERRLQAARDVPHILRRAGVIERPTSLGLLEAGLGLVRGEHRLSALLRLNALERPDKLAIIDRRRRVSFGALDRRVNRVARVLTAGGAGRGSTVAIMLANSVEFLEVALACHRLGASYTPIAAGLKRREIDYVLDHCCARLVVTDAAHVGEIDLDRHARLPIFVSSDDRPDAGCRWLEREVARASSAPLPIARPGDDGDAVIMYTSGTTGRPKGARRDVRANKVDELVHMIGAFDLGRHDTFFICTPLYHAAPWAFSNMLLGLGATLVLAPRWEGLESLRWMAREGVTGMLVVPTLVRRWLELERPARLQAHPRRLTKVISAGAKFPAQWKIAATQEIGEIFYDFYGATEIGVISVSDPHDTRCRPESVGRPMPYVELRIIDEAGRDVPRGTRGELYARGQTFAGYLHDAEAVRDASLDGYFSVGDIAVLEADGYLHIVDRIADMVVSGGVNIYPAEIENALMEHAAIQDVAVLGVPDDEYGEALHAFVVVQPEGPRLRAEDVVAFCQERLARFKRPRHVTFVDALPRSPQGKVLKRVLRAGVVGAAAAEG